MGINLYQFAGNSPINYVDSFGLYWSLFGLGFGQTATYMNPNGTLGYGTPASEQAPSNPDTYGAMRAAMIGDPNDNNFNGLTGAQVAQQMGQAAAEAAVGMMVPGGPQEEGAYQAADEALQAAQAAKAANKCELRPYGGPGGGHHVPAKKAFEKALNYDPNKALAIPNSVLEDLGVNHGAVSGAQNSLYSAYAQTGQTLTWDAVQSIETQALTKGGMNSGLAKATVSQAIDALKNAGGPGPTQIPWGN